MVGAGRAPVKHGSCRDPAEAMTGITGYVVAFYNTHRLYSTLAYRSPADYGKAAA